MFHELQATSISNKTVTFCCEENKQINGQTIKWTDARCCLALHEATNKLCTYH